MLSAFPPPAMQLLSPLSCGQAVYWLVSVAWALADDLAGKSKHNKTPPSRHSAKAFVLQSYLPDNST